MQDSSTIHYDPFYLGWHIISSSCSDAGMYGDPLSSTQDASSYDDTYYLTYEEVHDPQKQSWCKTRTDQEYNGNEMPHSLYGTCLGDYTIYFGCYWGENEVEDEQYLNYSAHVEPTDYSEEQWLCDGVDFGGATIKDDDSCACDYSGCWKEAMTLYERIFGH